MLEGVLTTAVFTFRILLAAVFGILIGLGREKRRKGAGSRTFALIALGATLFTILSVHGFTGGDEYVRRDPARISSNIVTGIGFLGAGVIWRERDNMVHGLTTAAGIWVSAAIGTALGVGYYSIAFATFVAVLVIMSLGHPFEDYPSRKRRGKKKKRTKKA